MLFIVRFSDKAESISTRQKFLSAHLDWLEQHQNVVLVAGSLRADMDTAPVGGLWVVEAQSKAEVESMFLTDPFWVQGIRQGFEILHWSKAFPERLVPI